jgi:quinol monooxygenase YgiN
MIVLISHLTTKPGMEEECKQYCLTMEQESRKEPGCLLYIAHRSIDNPSNFVFYEQYKDETALQSHRDSPHFARYIRGGIDSLVADRHRELFVPLS